MKLDIGGTEKFDAPIERLWVALNDPAVLTRCIPGCSEMIPTGEDQYKVILNLKVAAVGGSFEGAIALTDKVEPNSCRITVSGSGTLGQGSGNAKFSLGSGEGGATLMDYGGEGEVGGLVAGVGQRILKGVAKHLIKRFFTALKSDLSEHSSAA
jgi:carbon monoxide dehydrogenase subunit G